MFVGAWRGGEWMKHKSVLRNLDENLRHPAPLVRTVEIHTNSTIRGGGETWGLGINTIMKKGLAMASRPEAWLNSELNNLYEKNFIRREGHV